MERIEVRAHFHAGHRQLDYEGKCAWVHGHTWRGRFVVEAERFPRDATTDMSVDFGALKQIFRRLDHKMLISARDELFQDASLFDPEGVVVMPGDNPSVENVATYCLNEAAELLAKVLPETQTRYRLEATIQETDNNTLSMDRAFVW
jgi:6-pyruvoyltetrahydropterin/6-carboxytetrahydropterin synthase